MAQCNYADIDYLVSFWPGVRVLLQQKWRLTVVNAVVPGDYTVSINGQPFPYPAQPGDDVEAIRNGVQQVLTIGTALVSSQPFSNNRLDLTEVEVGTIETLAFVGPNDGDVAIEQTGPANNDEQLQFYLDATECLVNCCILDCALPTYHAAWAAHKVFTATNTDSNGITAGDFEEWKLGPARLKRGSNASANVSQGDLARTDPGKEILQLQQMYVPPVMCGPGCAVGWC